MAIRTGKAILRVQSENPSPFAALMLAISCIRDGTEPPDGVTGKLRSMVTTAIADDEVHRLARELDEHGQTAVESGKVKTDRLRAEWDGQFGTIPDAEYPNVDFDQWQELAVRAGISAERCVEGDWTPGDFLPAIRGYLRRLLDAQRGAAAGDKNAPDDDDEDPSYGLVFLDRRNRMGETVNDQMMQIVTRDNRCIEWSKREWSKILECSKTAIQNSQAWKVVIKERVARQKRLNRGPM